MSLKFIILDKEFSTQKKLREYVDSILKKYPHKSALNQEDFKFMRALLNYHPESKDKTAGGIKAFTVDGNEYGNSCFYIQQNDGKHIDFSYLKCIQNYKS